MVYRNILGLCCHRHCLHYHADQLTFIVVNHDNSCRRHYLHRDRTSMSQLVFGGSPSRGGDVTVYVLDINLPSLPTPFYSVLVSVSVFMALSTVFHSVNSPYNSPFSDSVPLVLSLPYWSFQLYVSL